MQLPRRQMAQLNYSPKLIERLYAECRSHFALCVILSGIFVVQSLAQFPPTISAISDQWTFPNLPTRLIRFVIGDAETPADQLSVSATSTNTSVVPATNIV